MSLQTQFAFKLPLGYIDQAGVCQRSGMMRLATAQDEIEVLCDPRVQHHDAYLPALLLSRVVTQLGDLSAVTPQVILELFAADLGYLEDLYQHLNRPHALFVEAICPHCTRHFELRVTPVEWKEEV